MKIPEDYEYTSKLINSMEEIALSLSIEYGVVIQVFCDFKDESLGRVEDMDRLFFQVDDHEFDSLKDLRKALRNKAFM